MMKVQVTSEAYGVVAKREVAIHPRSRCLCNLHCECACMSSGLECELMSEKDYHAAGFRGSLPVLTAKPPDQMWFVEHPVLAFFIIIVVMLQIGLIKALIGLLGCHRIGDFGMENVIYRRGKIKNYIQPKLKHLDPVYDDEGYPIHPHTGERVRVTTDIMLVVYNMFFLFFWPCLQCRKCFEKTFKLKKNLTKEAPHSYPGYADIYTDEEMEPSEETFSKREMEQKNKHSVEQEIPRKTSAIRGEKQNAAESTVDANKKEEGSYRRSREDSKVVETSFIPADLKSREHKQWQKGKQRVGEILFRKKKHSPVPPKE